MRRFFQSNNLKNVGFLIVLGTQIQAYASEFQYFGSEIDYWHNKTGPSKKDELKPTPTKPQATMQSNPEEKFSWNKYMDPKNKEFFKEGDYTPPEPFMETVRNPSDSNLKMWFAYLDKKNELTRKFQERMAEYLAKNGPTIDASARNTLENKLAALHVTEPDSKRYRFRMYFDSHCPHCKKMFGTLQELQNRGFFVEAKQVDTGPLGQEGIGIPASRANPAELQEKDIQSVPVLLIGDLKQKSVYRLSGYQSLSNVYSAIQQASAGIKSSTP